MGAELDRHRHPCEVNALTLPTAGACPLPDLFYSINQIVRPIFTFSSQACIEHRAMEIELVLFHHSNLRPIFTFSSQACIEHRATENRTSQKGGMPPLLEGSGKPFLTCSVLGLTLWVFKNLHQRLQPARIGRTLRSRRTLLQRQREAIEFPHIFQL